MGLRELHDTDVYKYILTCIPIERDIEVNQVFDNYELSIKPQHMSMFGTMCDYGVRARQINRCFGYVEIGIAKNYIRDDLSRLLEDSYLSAEDAYELVTLHKALKLGNDLISDYNVVTDRAVTMYYMLRLRRALYGAFYTAPEPVNYFECDCASNTIICDMKVSRRITHNRSYWAQVLLYSLMAKMIDGVSRRTIILLYPVQGVIKSYTYSDGEYSAMYKEFLERKWT